MLLKQRLLESIMEFHLRQIKNGLKKEVGPSRVFKHYNTEASIGYVMGVISFTKKHLLDSNLSFAHKKLLLLQAQKIIKSKLSLYVYKKGFEEYIAKNYPMISQFEKLSVDEGVSVSQTNPSSLKPEKKIQKQDTSQVNKVIREQVFSQARLFNPASGTNPSSSHTAEQVLREIAKSFNLKNS